MIKVRALKPLPVSRDGVSVVTIEPGEIEPVSEAAAVHFVANGMAERVGSDLEPADNLAAAGPSANASTTPEQPKKKGGRPPRVR